MKNTRNNVAPGASGFTGSFYNLFWKLLRSLVTRAINKSFEWEYLYIMQKLGIVPIIPKGDKDPKPLSNWTPLTFLNTFYKLISSVLAERLTPLLEELLVTSRKRTSLVDLLEKLLEPLMICFSMLNKTIYQEWYGW